MSEKLQNSNPPATKNKYTWIYLLIPILLVSFVGFKYIKGITAEKRAEKAILAYVEQTYGNQLDKFEYTVGDTTTINGLSSKVTAYHLSFYDQKFWGGSFLITADLDNNIIYDGYRDWYLYGGTLVEHYNTLYMDTEYTLEKPIYAEATKNNVCTLTDKLAVSANLRYKTKVAGNGYGNILVEPRLDPGKEYSVDELAKVYGETFITLQTNNSSEDDFIKFANFCAEYFKNSDWKYKNLVICSVPTNDDNVLYRAVTLTSDEISDSDIQKLINDKVFDYTQADMKKDAEIINSGNDWPEPYRYAFICRINS